MHFSRIDWNSGDPTFIFDDFDNRERSRFSPLGKTFTIIVGDNRYCIGYYDLETLESHPCPYCIHLHKTDKGSECALCRKKSSFNPAFYNASVISPEQSQYNNKPHIVYLAWFCPGVVKVGIAMSERAVTRLKEQGARYAIVVAQTANALEARRIEKDLSSKWRFPERLTNKQKIEYVLKGEPNLAEAQMELHEQAKRSGMPVIREYGDINRSYFAKDIDYSSLFASKMNEPRHLSGECVGLIGSLGIMRQGDIFFISSIKELISHEACLHDGVCIIQDFPENGQMSLW